MNITDQEHKWFVLSCGTDTLVWNVDYAILDPMLKVAASIQYPAQDFLKKHGFKFEEELPPRTLKAQSTFPWYIDLAMKTVYFKQSSWNLNLQEKKTVKCLPSVLVAFCSIPKVEKQLQARNLGIL
jgi:hypothetical protein